MARGCGSAVGAENGCDEPAACNSASWSQGATPAKHGVSFEQTCDVCDDPLAIDFVDDREGSRLLEGDKPRIISARKRLPVQERYWSDRPSFPTVVLDQPGELPASTWSRPC